MSWARYVFVLDTKQSHLRMTIYRCPVTDFSEGKEINCQLVTRDVDVLKPELSSRKLQYFEGLKRGRHWGVWYVGKTNKKWSSLNLLDELDQLASAQGSCVSFSQGVSLSLSALSP